ncbi:MAG: hypothetical protein BWK75_02535 [Candidatus Altiarchaeales archaeon A3]|nr:MAG: hypothetical protein BWK75_02535 [Candidatus Altiarchaeales archaeon A3]
MAYKRDEEKFKNIAEERVEILFILAKKFCLTDVETAKNYVKAAVRIAKFCNLRLGKKKALFCKRCFTFFNSENSRVRLNSKKNAVEILCLNCRYKRSYGYGTEKNTGRGNRNTIIIQNHNL